MMSNPQCFRVLAAVAAVACTLAARPADACGGLFCSGGAPIAVEQNAERVLFTKNADGTYSAYVEISYSGAPSEFSWVVPVPEEPQLGVVPPTTLQLLDLMTRPTITAPPTTCTEPFDDGGGFGCAEASLGGAANFSPRAGEDDADGGVNVKDLPRVGPFEPKVVSADDPTLIFDWLNENGYLLTEQMRPFINGYATKKMKFLALKLAPDAQTSDIAPIKMTYSTPCPAVPLSLTAVSAEPEMSVLVMFFDDSRVKPINYKSLEIRAADVRMDAQGRNNYYALVSREIDTAGGRAFVTELATPASKLPNPAATFVPGPNPQEAQQAVNDLINAGKYFTRLYARLSAWEMTLDPEFEASSDDGDVSNVLDLSTHPALEVCAGSRQVPCGSTYCGPGSSCGVASDGTEGCVCKAGTLARAVNEPNLQSGSQPAVACQDAEFDVIRIMSLGPCSSFRCTGGRCHVTGGFATCQCDTATDMARLDFAGSQNGQPTGMTCVKPASTFGAEQIVWKEGVVSNTPAADSGGCSAGAGLPWVYALALAFRRRRA